MRSLSTAEARIWHSSRYARRTWDALSRFATANQSPTPAAGHANRFAYPDDDPITKIDPTGGGAIGGEIGDAYGVCDERC
jgi:hypothetical protein